MKTEATQSARLSLLEVVNQSQTPVDPGVLRILYKETTDQNALPAAENGGQNAQGWDHAWFANYE